MSASENELGRLIVDRAFRVVPLDVIKVDHSYQRPLKRSYKKIVENFDINSLGVIVLAQREDGSLYVIDGQQRLAALKDLGWTAVRAEVLSSDGPLYEAEKFNTINMNRRKLNMYEQFKALLAAGNRVAVLSKNTCARFGFDLLETGKSSRIAPEVAFTKVSCIKMIMDYVDAHGIKPLEFALDTLNKCWKPNPNATNSVVIGGLMDFYIKNKDAKPAKFEKALYNLKLTPPHTIYQQAAALSAAKRTNPVNCACEVIESISNKRRR